MDFTTIKNIPLRIANLNSVNERCIFILRSFFFCWFQVCWISWKRVLILMEVWHGSVRFAITPPSFPPMWKLMWPDCTPKAKTYRVNFATRHSTMNTDWNTILPTITRTWSYHDVVKALMLNFKKGKIYLNLLPQHCNFWKHAKVYDQNRPLCPTGIPVFWSKCSVHCTTQILCRYCNMSISALISDTLLLFQVCRISF